MNMQRYHWKELGPYSGSNPRYRHVIAPVGSTLPQLISGFESLPPPIHPLWRWAAWRNAATPTMTSSARVDRSTYDLSRQYWDNMIPALRLATTMLRRARPILALILKAPYTLDNGNLCFDETYVPTTQDMNDLESFLLRLARTYRIFYMADQMRHDLQQITLGITAAYFNNDSPSTNYQTLWVTYSAIATETLQEFGNVRWNKKTPFVKQCISLSLATTLLHELGHACFQQRHREEYHRVMTGTDDPDDWVFFTEPALSPGKFNELGSSVISWLFGFEPTVPWAKYLTDEEVAAGLTTDIVGVRPVMDGTRGLRARFKDENNQHLLGYSLPPEMISLFFNRRFWRDRQISIMMIRDDLSQGTDPLTRVRVPDQPGII